MKRFLLLSALSLSTLPPFSAAASSGLTLTSAGTLRLSTPKEDYSGITWLGGNNYAVVSDTKDGFYTATITINPVTGMPTGWTRGAFYNTGTVNNDNEGIVYVPSTNTVFISGEKNPATIIEYRLDGTPTGRSLAIPSMFTSPSMGNYGFESLAFSADTGLFWTTSESTLARDGTRASPTNLVNNLLRLQAFDANTLQPTLQLAYKMDINAGYSGGISNYAHGVSEMLALPDGRLLVMEREFIVPSGLSVLSSRVISKIYVVDPLGAMDVTAVGNLRTLADSAFLEKELLWSQTTTLSASNIANWEGMCLGPTLEDGSVTVILINDSQAGYMGVLNEYIQVLKLSGLPMIPEPSTYAALLGALSLALLLVRRRKNRVAARGGNIQ